MLDINRYNQSLSKIIAYSVILFGLLFVNFYNFSINVPHKFQNMLTWIFYNLESANVYVTALPIFFICIMARELKIVPMFHLIRYEKISNLFYKDLIFILKITVEFLFSVVFLIFIMGLSLFNVPLKWTSEVQTFMQNQLSIQPNLSIPVIIQVLIAFLFFGFFLFTLGIIQHLYLIYTKRNDVGITFCILIVFGNFLLLGTDKFLFKQFLPVNHFMIYFNKEDFISLFGCLYWGFLLVCCYLLLKKGYKRYPIES